MNLLNLVSVKDCTVHHYDRDTKFFIVSITVEDLYNKQEKGGNPSSFVISLCRECYEYLKVTTKRRKEQNMPECGLDKEIAMINF